MEVIDHLLGVLKSVRFACGEQVDDCVGMGEFRLIVIGTGDVNHRGSVDGFTVGVVSDLVERHDVVSTGAVVVGKDVIDVAVVHSLNHCFPPRLSAFWKSSWEGLRKDDRSSDRKPLEREDLFFGFRFSLEVAVEEKIV